MVQTHKQGQSLQGREGGVGECRGGGWESVGREGWVGECREGGVGGRVQGGMGEWESAGRSGWVGECREGGGRSGWVGECREGGVGECREGRKCGEKGCLPLTTAICKRDEIKNPAAAMASILAWVLSGAVRGMKITSTKDLWTTSAHVDTLHCAVLQLEWVGGATWTCTCLKAVSAK